MDLADLLPQAFLVADLHRSPAICRGKCRTQPLTSLCSVRALKNFLGGLLITLLVPLLDFIFIKCLIFFFGVWASGLVAFTAPSVNKYWVYFYYLYIVCKLAKSLIFSILGFYSSELR